MDIDITAGERKTLLSLLHTYLPGATVWAFGSRVKFTSKPESDLDLAAIMQSGQESRLADLKDAFAESDLPFKVDILDWGTIPDNFKKNIEKEYVALQDSNTEKERILKNWKSYRLKDVVTLNYGKALVTDKRTEGKIPVYSSSGQSGWHNEALIENDAIIVGRKGNVGSIYYVNEPFYCIDTAFFINPSDKYDLKFLYYKLQSMNLKKLTSDSAVPGLNRDTAYAQELIIPKDIDDQVKIASILSSLDDKTDLHHQMNQTLETIAQAIFKDWFVNFNFPGFDGELVDGLPKRWRTGSIYELMDVIYGFPFKSSLFNEDEQGIGLIRIRNLKNNKAGFYTTEKADDKYLVKPGDILAGMDAEFIPSIWYGEPAWLNQRVCKFKPKKDYVNELFILYSLIPLLERSQYGKVGTTVIHLGKSDIDQYQILIPEKEVLKELNKLFNPFHKRLIELELEIRSLTQIRDNLLPKLMTGKIRVN